MGTSITTKRIVISGYYGFHNSGDEAVLLSILQALEEQAREVPDVRIVPVVLSNDPAWTRKTYGVEAVHRMKTGDLFRAIRSCDGLISGGGSLLQDVTGMGSIPYYLGITQIARFFRKPVFIYSQGIGPVIRPVFQRMIRMVLKKADYVSVRDPKSADLLEKFGLDRPEIVPDPVMGLRLSDSFGSEAAGSVSSAKSAEANGLAADGDQAPVIGISVRNWNEDQSDLKAVAMAVVNIFRQLDGHVQFRFLPFHLPSDREASQFVYDKALRIAGEEAARHLKEQMVIIRDHEHPEAMLAEVSQCNVLIGMRLHSLIYAANQRVPMVGVSYDPKVDAFLRQLEVDPATSVEDPNADQIVQQTTQLLQNQAVWRQEKEALIHHLQKKSQQPAQHIVTLVRQNR